MANLAKKNSLCKEAGLFLALIILTRPWLLCNMITLMFISIIQLERNLILNKASPQIKMPRNQTNKKLTMTNFYNPAFESSLNKLITHPIQSHNQLIRQPLQNLLQDRINSMTVTKCTASTSSQRENQYEIDNL